jgi:hypothetical protein
LFNIVIGFAASAREKEFTHTTKKKRETTNSSTFTRRTLQKVKKAMVKQNPSFLAHRKRSTGIVGFYHTQENKKFGWKESSRYLIRPAA